MLRSKMGSRLFIGAKGLKDKLTVPEKLKGGRLEKIGNYFYTIFADYKTVLQELVQDMREKPIKSTVYISLMVTAAVLYKTNPSEHSFRTIMIENANDLALVGDLIRSSSSDKYMQSLVRSHKDGRVHYQSLGLCSIVYTTDMQKTLGLYSAQCKYVKPHWTKFHKSIIDVGVVGKWINTENAMVDYDVNENEWK